MSFTPEFIALSIKKGRCDSCAIICARVVFPVPGGPQKINEGIIPLAYQVRLTNVII